MKDSTFSSTNTINNIVVINIVLFSYSPIEVFNMENL